jgi:hypothetical protein
MVGGGTTPRIPNFSLVVVKLVTVRHYLRHLKLNSHQDQNVPVVQIDLLSVFVRNTLFWSPEIAAINKRVL